MFRRLVVALMLLVSPPVQADEAEVLAEYWQSSGSLPPQYAWSVSVSIHADRVVIVKRCKGFDKNGPNCTTQRVTADAARLDAIRAVVAASGLVETPAREATDFPVGGGSSGGTVYYDGTKVVLPPFPAEPDVQRVGTVLAAIVSALP